MRVYPSLPLRGKNVIIVLVSAVGGLLIPEVGRYLQPMVIPIVIFLIFSSLLESNLSESFGSYGKLLIVFLLLSYGVIPIMGLSIVNIFLSEESKTGFAIILATPTTAGSAIVWTRLSEGDVRFSTLSSLVSLCLSPLFTPILLFYLISESINVPTISILIDLIIILVGGMLLYIIYPHDSTSKLNMNRLTTAAIMLLIYIAVSNNNSIDISSDWLLSVSAVAFLLFFFGLLITAITKYMLGISSTKAISLFFVCNLKNLGIAILISGSYGEAQVLTTIIFYYVFQQLGSAIISDIDPKRYYK